MVASSHGRSYRDHRGPTSQPSCFFILFVFLILLSILVSVCWDHRYKVRHPERFSNSNLSSLSLGSRESETEVITGLISSAGCERTVSGLPP